MRDGVHELTRGTRIRCETDPREHPFHCHHEKTMVVDGEVAFVGGIDMTDFAGDRFDARSPSPPAPGLARRRHAPARARGDRRARSLRHALARGDRRDARAARRSRPPPASTTVQVVRTVAEGMYDAVPHGEFRILESYVRAIERAERSSTWRTSSCGRPRSSAPGRQAAPPALRRVPPGGRAARPGQQRTRRHDGQLGVLVGADDDAGRLLASTIRSRLRPPRRPLYVHAKVGIVDDRWLTVGSANLNAHSLLNDTEMNVITDDPGLARDTRLRLWAEHLELDRSSDRGRGPYRTVDERWRPVAFEQLERMRAGDDPTHRLLALPGLSRRSRRLSGLWWGCSTTASPSLPARTAPGPPGSSRPMCLSTTCARQWQLARAMRE